jgi:hypothetical protein
MNKTPIIVVIVAIIVLCCCSMCAVLWTVVVWQQANEQYQYEGGFGNDPGNSSEDDPGSGYGGSREGSMGARRHEGRHI